MIFRLRTSERTEKIFKYIEAREHLQPYCLAKLAIALAIRDETEGIEDLILDGNGLELNRQTITGDYDELFKCLIELKEKRHLSDEEYFPSCLKSYIDKGAVLLEQEYRYGTNIYTHLVALENSI